MSFNNLTKIFFIILVSINLSGCASVGEGLLKILMEVIGQGVFENSAKEDTRDYYDNLMLKHVNQLEIYGKYFYIGQKSLNHNYDEGSLFYKTDLSKFNRSKKNIIKVFIETYNKVNNTEYNAMVNIEISDRILCDESLEYYIIRGHLLKIEK